MKDKIVTLAKELIAIPSVSHDVEKAVEILEVAKRPLAGYEYRAFVSERIPSLLYSNQGKNRKEFKIILNAHLDVLAAGEKQFIPVEKDGRLYGRGAFDMKAAAAVNILLYKEMAHKVSFPLALQLTLDEEADGTHGTGYQIEKGVRGDFILIGESNSNFKIGTQAKGVIGLKITVTGKSSHSAYSWLGENALWKIYEVLSPVMKEFPHPKEETFTTTVTLTSIKIDNPAKNRLPEACTAYLDVRYIADDADTIIPKIRELLPDDVVCEVDRNRPYHYVYPDNPYIKMLQQATEKIIGDTLPLRSAHGTSDATFFSAVKCPAVEFGPIGANAHTDNEWVDIQSLEDYYAILKQFLQTVDKLSDESIIENENALRTVSPNVLQDKLTLK